MVRRLATAVAALALTVPLAALPASAGPPDGRGPGDRPGTPHRGVQWYLALGDSLAAGYQPDRDDLDGGYVGHVLDGLQEDYAKTKLVNLACSGETSTSMVEGGRCGDDQDSQLAQAERFLEAHKDKVSTVTVHIGANDVQRCVSVVGIDMACLASGLTDAAANLPLILTTLDEAAHPDTEIIVGDYYNPFLAAWLLGPDGQALAHQSAGPAAQLNGIIAAGAGMADAELADVAGAFLTTDTTMVPLLPGVDAPLNVVTICQLTWMCTLQDTHANDAGHAVMGEAFLEALAE